jgi:beta-glucosidase
MVKGSMDFVGINEYTAYYMYDPHQNKTKPNALGYQNDWNAGFACKIFPSSSKIETCTCVIWS